MLRQSNEGGGGDIQTWREDKLIGSWAGDRIVIVGDYDKSKLFQKAEEKYKDISKDIIDVLKSNGIEIKGFGE